MSRTRRIKIERLAIRLQGGDATDAQKLGAAIGREALQQIADQINVPGGRRSTRIAQIDAGTLRVGSGSQSSASSAAIAGQIARSISSRLTPGSKHSRK